MTYVRKTRDEYNVEQNWDQGWEAVCSENTRREARERLKEYRENQPEAPARIVKRRVKINQQGA
jgi:hypothetical protein